MPQPDTKPTILNLQIDCEMREALQAVARHEERNISQVVRQAIKAWLKKKLPAAAA